LPEGYIYPKAARAVRDLLRKRVHLVRQHTANVLSVQNIMARNTGARFSLKRIHALTKQELTSMLTEELQVLAITSSLTVLDCLRHQIKTLEQTVHKRLHHTPTYEQLLTVPGIGTRYWPKRSRWKPARSTAFPAWGTMRRIAAVWTAQRSAMASAKARAMSKMAIRIWRGRIWRRRSLPYAFSRPPSAFTNASWPRAATTRSWPGRPWPISWHALVITLCATLCLLRRRKLLAELWAAIGLRLEAGGEVG